MLPSLSDVIDTSLQILPLLNNKPSTSILIYIQAGDYEIEIGGIRYPADVRLNSPVLPSTVRRSRQESGMDPGGPTRHPNQSTAFDYEYDPQYNDHGKDPSRNPSKLSSYDYLDHDDDDDY